MSSMVKSTFKRLGNEVKPSYQPRLPLNNADLGVH
jgi:hypothetical protein